MKYFFLILFIIKSFTFLKHNNNYNNKKTDIWLIFYVIIIHLELKLDFFLEQCLYGALADGYTNFTISVPQKWCNILHN